jgi:Amt family ammonium transporter
MDVDKIVNKTSTQKNEINLNAADTAWVLASSCLVFIMLPGVGFYYGGMISRKSILTMLFSTLLSKAIVTMQV